MLVSISGRTQIPPGCSQGLKEGWVAGQEGTDASAGMSDMPGLWNVHLHTDKQMCILSAHEKNLKSTPSLCHLHTQTHVSNRCPHIPTTAADDRDTFIHQHCRYRCHSFAFPVCLKETDYIRGSFSHMFLTFEWKNFKGLCLICARFQCLWDAIIFSLFAYTSQGVCLCVWE